MITKPKTETNGKLKKASKEKRIKRLLFWISIALTFISLHAGFDFYKAMFGLSVAILTSFTFETLRIATLFGLAKKSGIHRTFSYALYIGVALVCSFASVASFHAKIIENYRIDTENMRKRQEMEIREIKQKQVEARNSRLESLEKDITWCNMKIAKNPGSDYWPVRLNQIEEKKRLVSAMYDSLLSFVPEKNVEIWIEKESLIYGIERSYDLDENGKSWAVTKALNEIWNVSDIAAKKIAAIIIVLGVELGILMLAILSKDEKQRHLPKNNGRLAALTEKFGEESVVGFLEAYREQYQKNGRMPHSSSLSRKMRRIKEEVMKLKLTKNEICNLMNLENG